MDLSNIFLHRNAESRSISAENPTGEKGKGAMAAAGGPSRELGPGWKARPCIMTLAAGDTVRIMDVEGPGVIRHIWITFDVQFSRDLILRMFWDDHETPSVECPIGDFFCSAWKESQNILGIPINVNPKGGMNIFFPMPFRKHARIEVQNDSPNDLKWFFYTIDYTLETVPEESLYFHALWRRCNPLEYGVPYVILDEARGKGQYVGTFMAWQQNSAGWWGEGELKMYIDGDKEHPTICGTGTEDYFGGAWGFGKESFSAPFFGFQQVGGRSEEIGARMTLYRFHIPDPVYFQSDIRVTIQALGWQSGGRYLPLQDDISSVAYWYQTLPHSAFPPLPCRNQREIV